MLESTFGLILLTESSAFKLIQLRSAFAFRCKQFIGQQQVRVSWVGTASGGGDLHASGHISVDAGAGKARLSWWYLEQFRCKSQVLVAPLHALLA